MSASREDRSFCRTLGFDLGVDLALSNASLPPLLQGLHNGFPVELQIWRWHPAMLSSILHRASAIICYIGLIKVAVGLLLIALNGKLPLEGLIFSPLGAIPLCFHLYGIGTASPRDLG